MQSRTHDSTIVFGLLAVLSVSGFVAAQTPVPVGSEIQINSYTTGDQWFPVVAEGPRGDFLVVWNSQGSPGNDNDRSVQGRRFDAAGTPVGDQFQVNTFSSGSQSNPVASIRPDSEYVVIWHSSLYCGVPQELCIIGQRFSATGDEIGDEFQVNSYATGDQSNPSIDLDGAGNFLVVWQSAGSYGPDNSETSIQAQILDAVLDPVGSEFQVNTYTTSKQEFPFVAGMDGGGFVVVWQSLGSAGSDTSITSIQGRRFDDLGVPMGVEIQVNTFTTSYQRAPAVDAAPDDSFIVVWDSVGSVGDDQSYLSVQGQRFDASGSAMGDQFQINTLTAHDQRRPRIAIDADGSFVVVFRSDVSFGGDGGQSVQGQRFDATGMATGSQFQVNTYAHSFQRFPSVAAGADGDFVVAWQSAGSYGSDISASSIQGQRFAVPIFSDGFESGDLSAWDGSAP